MKFQFSKDKNNIKFRFIKKILYSVFNEYSKKKLSYNWSEYPKRYDIINNLISKKGYQSYLEIGCKDDETFSKINCKYKVGVDPVSGGNIRTTSDDFFLSNKKFFDIIFIDGDHRFFQSFKDVENSIKYLNPKGLILLHDCLPRNIWEQSDPPLQYEWTGQVWKTLVKFRMMNEIDTKTIIADCGIGVIQKKKNSSILKLNKRFNKLKYNDYINNLNLYMRTIKYEDFIKEIT